MFSEDILRLRPCRRPLWQSQASWLLAWWLNNILIGLLACWVLLSGFVLLVLSVGVFAGSFVSGCYFHATFWYLQLPHYNPGVAHCFKTLGSDQFDGLLVW